MIIGIPARFLKKETKVRIIISVLRIDQFFICQNIFNLVDRNMILVKFHSNISSINLKDEDKILHFINTLLLLFYRKKAHYSHKRKHLNPSLVEISPMFPDFLKVF